MFGVVDDSSNIMRGQRGFLLVCFERILMFVPLVGRFSAGWLGFLTDCWIVNRFNTRIVSFFKDSLGGYKDILILNLFFTVSLKIIVNLQRF